MSEHELPNDLDDGQRDSQDLNEDDEIVADSVNITQAPVGKINAESVRMSGSSAGEIYASEVEIRQGGALKVQAERLDISQSNIANVEAEVAAFDHTFNGFVKANQVSINDGRVSILYSGSSELTNSATGMLVANEVRGDSIRSGVLLTSRVTGNVETVLDTPRAMLAGLTAGIATGLVIFMGTLLTRRKM
jgi:hypothetical protein